MFQRQRRMFQRQLGRARVSLGIILGTAVLLASAAPVAAVTPLRGSFGGQAWASDGNAEAGMLSVTLGRSAFQPCPCRGTDGELRVNTIRNIVSSNEAQYRANTTKATAWAAKSTERKTARVQMTAQARDITLLGGRIHADAILGVSTTRADVDSFKTSSAGSKFIGLNILGQEYGSSVAPNTRVNLPGLGFVKLNEVRRFGDGVNRKGIDVTMMRIVITEPNDLDLGVGAEIRVAYARSLYDRAVVRSDLDGAAHGGDAKNTTNEAKNHVGRSAPIYLTCRDTNGAVLENFVAEVTAEGLFTAQNARSTAASDQADALAWARTTSHLQDANVMDGLITADEVKAVSRSEWAPDAATGSTSSQGSYFTNLRVAGVPIGDEQRPNTTVPLPGVGRVTFYETTATSGPDGVKLDTIMIHVIVTEPANPMGLPVGSEFRIGVARTGAGPY